MVGSKKKCVSGEWHVGLGHSESSGVPAAVLRMLVRLGGVGRPPGDYIDPIGIGSIPAPVEQGCILWNAGFAFAQHAIVMVAYSYTEDFLRGGLRPTRRLRVQESCAFLPILKGGRSIMSHAWRAM